MSNSETPQASALAWVPVSLIGRKVTDVDGELVSLEFTLDLPDDKAWYQCFAQARGPARAGSHTYMSTNPQFATAELLTWKVELSDIPDAVHYLVERVEEANHDFIALLERKEQIRRQLDEAARRRERAITEAQRVLDENWPVPSRALNTEEAREASAHSVESTQRASSLPLTSQHVRSTPTTTDANTTGNA
jgi:hypothetical protein